jgi:fumarylacetoacetase
MACPTRIGDYTDFYTSIHHARNVGRMIRPDDPLTANFQWMPIAYHGRASSVVVSGKSSTARWARPCRRARPRRCTGLCARLDYELELGIFIGTGNALGEPMPLAQAEVAHLRHLPAQRLVGARHPVLGDGAARPLPGQELLHQHLALDRHHGGAGSPTAWAFTGLQATRSRWPTWTCGQPAQGALDIQLEVWLETALRARRGLAGTAFRHQLSHQYWTVAQMVTHHTMGGCNLQSGDLLGSGTISGPAPEEAGAMIELSRAARRRSR